MEVEYKAREYWMGRRVFTQTRSTCVNISNGSVIICLIVNCFVVPSMVLVV